MERWTDDPEGRVRPWPAGCCLGILLGVLLWIGIGLVAVWWWGLR